jgi:hypothetical protein
MKALANGELKLLLNTSDDYRKCCMVLTNALQLPKDVRKVLGTIKCHTYRLQEEKPFTIFFLGSPPHHQHC